VTDGLCYNTRASNWHTKLTAAKQSRSLLRRLNSRFPLATGAR